MTEGRIPCVVPFCRRTSERAEFSEWICGDHWRLLPNVARRVYGRHMRRWRRYGPQWVNAPAADRLWRWIKRQAIERAAGI